MMLLFNVNGQDIHFSQFDKTPTNLNPALTGSFNGDWRFSANQRSQWRSVSRSFNTFGFGIENNEELLNENLFHGINYLNDVAGDGDYRTHDFNITNAYRLNLGLDSSKVLTIGGQIGVNHKAIDYNAFKYDVQFNGYKYDYTLPNNETFLNERYTNINIGLGVAYHQTINIKMSLETGFAVFNIVRQQQKLVGETGVIRDRRFSFHANIIHKIDREWYLMPGVLFQKQGVYHELVFGSNIKYVQKDKRSEYIAPYGGVWLRANDAINIVAGLYYNNWVMGISYDINVSELSPASNVRGGLEFSFQYILSIFKPKLSQYRTCPDYL